MLDEVLDDVVMYRVSYRVRCDGEMVIDIIVSLWTWNTQCRKKNTEPIIGIGTSIVIPIPIPPPSPPSSTELLSFSETDPNQSASSLPSRSPVACDPSRDPPCWDGPRHSTALDESPATEWRRRTGSGWRCWPRTWRRCGGRRACPKCGKCVAREIRAGCVPRVRLRTWSGLGYSSAFQRWTGIWGFGGFSSAAVAWSLMEEYRNNTGLDCHTW